MSDLLLLFRTGPRLPPTKAAGPLSMVLLVLAACLTAAPKIALAQQRLVLSAGVGKRVFFEGEPIYLLVRLQNVGTDTAWTTPFSLASEAVTFSVRRGDGKAVPENRLIGNFLSLRAWRGEPIPPGASELKTQVLQDLVGEGRDYRSHLFRNHLPPSQYELRVAFAAHAGVPQTTPLAAEAAPITFQIRERTPDEENEVKELEAMRKMGWDTTRVAGYPRAAGYNAALIDWVERRLSTQPDDPFLPYLLHNGLYGVGQVLATHILAGELPRFDPDTSEVVSRLRLAVIERHRHSTAGAYVVQGLTARHPDQQAVLMEQLRATPAGEMARYQVERNQHAKQFKKQPPR